MIDLRATSRPEAIPVRDQMLAYLGERKEAFHKVRVVNTPSQHGIALYRWASSLL